MKILGTYKSSVVKDRSYRTTVPLPVARALELEHQSKLAWSIIIENEEVKVVVRKL